MVDIVEIITSPSSRPSPNWLSYVRTGKARSAIRHRLRTVNLAESQALGKRLLTNALTALGVDADLPTAVVERLLNESSAKTLDELYADIGIGTRMAPLVARHIIGCRKMAAMPCRCSISKVMWCPANPIRWSSTATKVRQCNWRNAVSRFRATLVRTTQA